MSFRASGSWLIFVENFVMLHYSKVGTVLGAQKSFSFVAVAKSTGEIITGVDCTCTSNYVYTLNIRWPSGEIRKLYKVLFLEINGKKIFV